MENKKYVTNIRIAYGKTNLKDVSKVFASMELLKDVFTFYLNQSNKLLPILQQIPTKKL